MITIKWRKENDIKSILIAPSWQKIILKIMKIISKKIDEFVHEYVYNLGNSAQVGADYIINAVVRKINDKKNKESK